MPQDLSAELRAHYGHHFTTTRNGMVTGEHFDFGRHPLVGKAIAALEAQAAEIARLTAERDGLRVAAERLSRLPCLPTPRVLASGSIAGKRVELHGWHTDDIEIWERQHGIKFGAAREST